MKPLFPLVILLACLLMSCSNPSSSVNTPQSTTANTASSGAGQRNADAANVGVVSSHAGGGAGSATTSSDKASVPTPELDAKIEIAVAKAQVSGATESDKKAAAKAYFERADFYREQGSPALYKFALADYRRGLRLDTTNAEAREKMNEIVSIYQSMGRPVPELGKE